ncbi:FYVE zinc finger domain-containing protein, partial [Globisporangium polare]
QQPEIHYIIHQDAMGPDGRPLPSVGADGRPIAYQQIQPGQFVPMTTAAYAPPTATKTTDNTV